MISRFFLFHRPGPFSAMLNFGVLGGASFLLGFIGQGRSVQC